MGEPRSPRGLIAYKPPLSQPGRAAQKRTSSEKGTIYLQKLEFLDLLSEPDVGSCVGLPVLRLHNLMVSDTRSHFYTQNWLAI